MTEQVPKMSVKDKMLFIKNQQKASPNLSIQ